MARLSVNLNKIALIRNTRALGIPSVVRAARTVISAGADGITVHPRSDGRHVRADDVDELANLLKATPEVEFNVEGNPFHNLLEYARRVRPHQCTLVPDESGQFTSDHGWDLPKDGARLTPIVAELKSLGIRVSVFMDPLPIAMQMVHTLGADRIELYTEPYAQAFGTLNQASALKRYTDTAAAARLAGLEINAGHDLNLDNLPEFVRAIPDLKEVSIGHALVSDALEFGLAETVKRYLAAARGG
ncbi:MAG: pyridoxine 5'-phosphate synthase [Burkholderiales bacterium]|nr:pyridoxine 5'-phosphate synthase [Burkholderiales bacterium]